MTISIEIDPQIICGECRHTAMADPDGVVVAVHCAHTARGAVRIGDAWYTSSEVDAVQFAAQLTKLREAMAGRGFAN